MNPPADIDALIHEAEQRLIQREQRWRRDVQAFGHQLHVATRPQRLIRPALITAAVAAVLVLWPSSRRKAAAPLQRQHAAGPPPLARPALFALLAGIPWTRVLSHAWPLLPGHWQQRLNPATAASLLTFGLPLLERLMARRKADEPG